MPAAHASHWCSAPTSWHRAWSRSSRCAPRLARRCCGRWPMPRPGRTSCATHNSSFCPPWRAALGLIDYRHHPHTMATHLDLQEQEQVDALKAFWQQYGNLITWALVAALLVYSGITGWQYWQREQAGKAGAMFDELDRAANAGDV